MTLEALKNYLRITWDDSETDNRLTDILTRSEDILSSYAGVKITFDESNPAECQLLLDLCRYINNEAYEEFKINFSAELISLRAKYAVMEADKNEEVQT
ncbi:MAG: hypothetical protein K2J79_09375 [Ruminiclostridium sp.]|nr:hypothetical protein [Ruminiclostridium sp.]